MHPSTATKHHGLYNPANALTLTQLLCLPSITLFFVSTVQWRMILPSKRNIEIYSTSKAWSFTNMIPNSPAGIHPEVTPDQNNAFTRSKPSCALREHDILASDILFTPLRKITRQHKVAFHPPVRNLGKYLGCCINHSLKRWLERGL